MMTYHATFRCPDHPPFECGDYLIRFAPELRQYTILIHDGDGCGASSGVIIAYCPWCGTRLPEPLETAEEMEQR